MKTKQWLSGLLCAVLILMLPAGVLAASDPGAFIFDVSEGKVRK